MIDTNIILDIAFKREPHYKNTGKILFYIENHSEKIKAYLTATTITDKYYIVAKDKKRDTALSFIRDLLYIIDIVGVDKTIIFAALQSELNDFEDAVQDCSAINNGIQNIITRNKEDFTGSILDIFTPIEFLNSIAHS
ncbi:MAG: PIN domain-containing protein [Spirochaetales bacterium]|nr:PIN domain-containing protein [Spirochaetales bacterium]